MEVNQFIFSFLPALFISQLYLAQISCIKQAGALRPKRANNGSGRAKQISCIKKAGALRKSWPKNLAITSYAETGRR